MEAAHVSSTVQLIVLMIFIGIYILIFTERIHRTTASLFGATLMVIVGRYFGILTPEEVIHMIEFDVIALLVGTMIIVAVLMPTGFFEFLAIKSAKIARGKPWLMLVIFGTVTAVLSMFVNNVTTILLILPVTIMVANTLRISAAPILLTEAIMSNVGGVGTLIGDPPNVMIASAAGFTFMDFIINLMPPTLIAIGVTILMLRLFYKDYIKNVPKNVEEILSMDEKSLIKDEKSMKITVLILLFTIFLFLIHHKLGLEPFEVAMLGGVLALLLNRVDPHKILLEIEWSTLFFFAGLFIIVGTVDKVGILATVASKLAEFIGDNIILAIAIVLWVSAIVSAIVDNIPFTAAMIPVILHMESLGIDVTPLWWALAIGAGFGGNGTYIGSSSGVIVIGMSEKYGHTITPNEWLRKGFPVMIATCLVGMLYLFVYFKILGY